MTYRVPSKVIPVPILSLDLFSVVAVQYGALTQTARVISLSHKITPTRWTVDIEFTDIRAGLPSRRSTTATRARRSGSSTP